MLVFWGCCMAEWEVSRQRRVAVRLTHCPHERNFEVTELPNCLGAQNNEGIFKVLFSRRGYFFSTKFMIDFTIAWLINIHLNHKTLHGFQKGVAQLFQIRS